MSDTRKAPLLQAQDVVKRFPGVVALAGVSFVVRAGEVHGLVGENGAGKSTLIKLLSGYYSPDEGSIIVGDDDLPPTPTAAQRAGIATIHQEHHLVPDLSARENVMLGTWPARFGLVDRKVMAGRADAVLAKVAPRVRGAQSARTLSPADGQLTEVARGLAREAQILILDEPTTALGGEDVERLFALLKALRDEGIAIVYVSHKLEEIFELADWITVLRDGRTVSSGAADQYTVETLVRAMVGTETELYEEELAERPTRDEATSEAKPPVLEVSGLSRRGVLHDVSLTVRMGEILGIGGLGGAGRTELARCIMGADPVDHGTVSLNGKALRLKSPRDAVAAGIGLVPEERRAEGLFPLRSVRENVAVTLWKRLSRFGFVPGASEARIATGYIDTLRVKTPSVETAVSTLSGGNQQKVVIARWLAAQPKLLILDEPTKGIDVGAKAEIHRLIQSLADEGLAVIVISSELPELIALAHRVAVMRAGRLVGELTRQEATKESVLALATGSGEIE